jgi:hypothetical protein
MIRDPLGSAARAAPRSWLSSRNLLVAGAAVNALAVLLAMREADTPAPLRVGLILTGLALAIAGVNHRLRNFAEALDERTTTAGYLALGSFDVLLAYLACSEAWDTFRMVLGAFVAVGLAGALLVLLPGRARRAVIVALVVFHFVGILTAVFSPAPPNGVSNWTVGTAWMYIYRPYLQFMYLNNAYHFYSPEPGPATQLWFRVSYQPHDGQKVPPHWFMYPNREDFPSRLLYQRALAMTESTAANRPGPLTAEFYAGSFQRRRTAQFRIPFWSDLPPQQRPLAPPDVFQYKEPTELAKKYIASYARHVAHDPKFRSPDAPDAAVERVKVYRVLHNFLTPAKMAEGMAPDDPLTLMPVYVGEFDAEGTLKDPQDPLLYWVVPILPEPDGHGGYAPKDYVAVHAGDTKSVLDLR